MIIGTNQIHTADDHTDMVGLRRLVLYQNWQASTWPLSIAQFDAEEPAVPEVPGGMWLVDRQRRRVGGVMRTFWAFEGVNGTGKDVTFRTRGNSPDYGFTPGFAEVPIQQHPRIEALVEQYEGQVIDNEIIWPRLLGDPEKKNPMFGRASYFSFQGGTYYYRYMARSASELPDLIGRVLEGGLPGEAPRASKRNWLCAGIPWVRRGPAAIEAMELYWLSDEGGWPKPIYGKNGGSGNGNGFNGNANVNLLTGAPLGASLG